MFRRAMKQLPLGRWQTDKTMRESMRLADLANYDSCGTCGMPEKDTWIALEDDVIDVGYMPIPGSFDVYKKKTPPYK